MIYTIENHSLRVAVNSKGAELDSIFNKDTALEYMWGAEPAWNKKSPVLFPIVGTLKENRYIFENNNYSLPRHGFAREKEFALESQTDVSLRFLLRSDDETKQVYPFDFLFYINYQLEAAALHVSYEIHNTGSSDMYFSVGGHPAFKLPLVPDTNYEDYFLEFEERETTGRWPISPEGLIETEPVEVFHDSNILPLIKELFFKDALVFKDLRSHSVTLKSGRTPHGFQLQFPGFPYLGIWAAKNADFVCIEPWCGIADSTDANQQLKNKEGINRLPAGQQFLRSWKLVTF